MAIGSTESTIWYPRRSGEILRMRREDAHLDIPELARRMWENEAFRPTEWQRGQPLQSPAELAWHLTRIESGDPWPFEEGDEIPAFARACINSTVAALSERERYYEKLRAALAYDIVASYTFR